jgi:hypothetical protein
MSPTKLIDMVAERVFESMTRITNKINTDLITGNGTDSITSAQNIVGFETAFTSNGTYAGQTTVSALSSNIFGSDSSPAVFSVAQVANDLSVIKTRSDEKPDFIMVHPYLAVAIQSVLESNRRIFNQDNVLGTYSTGPSNAWRGADTGVTLYGVPVLSDIDGYYTGTPGLSPSQGFAHLYYLSKRHLALDIMPHSNPFDGSVWEDESFLSSGGAEDDVISGPVVSIVSLARLGLASSFAVNVECQLKVKRPMAMGIRKGVAI